MSTRRLDDEGGASMLSADVDERVEEIDEFMLEKEPTEDCDK